MRHAASPEILGRIFSLLGFAVTLLLWNWVARPGHRVWLAPAVALIVPALIFPITWIGRSSLNRDPSSAHASVVTRVVHFLVMCALGSALISAVIACARLHWASIPFPQRLGEILTALSGCFVLLTVITLAARGLGAPFAISLSKRLATDWLYARTRNPMVLSVFVFLFCLSLRLHSSLLLTWELLVLIPAMTIFVRFYEERELEIRFGTSYEQYRAHTPMFFPRLRK